MDTTTERPLKARLTELPAGDIHAGNNDRKDFDPTELAKLADSIRELGILHPPTVRPDPDGGFAIVEGERRYRAMADVLGWQSVPVVLDAEMDDETASFAMLAENVLRVDLDPIAEGWAYRTRMEAFDLSYSALAERVGVSWNRIEAKVRLTRLGPEAQHLIRVGRLPETAAWAMDRLDLNRQRLACAATMRGDLEIPAFRALCARLQAEQDQEALFDPDSFMQIEEYLAEAHAAAKVSKPEQMRRLLRAMAHELGQDHPLSRAANELAGVPAERSAA